MPADTFIPKCQIEWAITWNEFAECCVTTKEIFIETWLFPHQTNKPLSTENLWILLSNFLNYFPDKKKYVCRSEEWNIVSTLEIGISWAECLTSLCFTSSKRQFIAKDWQLQGDVMVSYRFCIRLQYSFHTVLFCILFDFVLLMFKWTELYNC